MVNWWYSLVLLQFPFALLPVGFVKDSSWKKYAVEGVAREIWGHCDYNVFHLGVLEMFLVYLFLCLNMFLSIHVWLMNNSYCCFCVEWLFQALFKNIFTFVCLLVEGMGGGHGKRRKVILITVVVGKMWVCVALIVKPASLWGSHSGLYSWNFTSFLDAVL